MIDDRAHHAPSPLQRAARIGRALAASAIVATLLVDPRATIARSTPGSGPVPVVPDGPRAGSRTAGAGEPGSDATGTIGSDSATPIPGASATGGGGSAATDPGGPSIIAIDAAAHAGDRIRFTPGGAVSVPFRPRPDDGWIVGGVRPARLPAGAATGRALATSREGAVWTPGSTAPQATVALPAPGLPRPIDTSSGPPAPAADASAFVAPASERPATSSARDLRRQVFGFLPYWELTDRSTTLDYDLLSTIAYFGVGASAKGDLVKRNADGSVAVGWAGWASSRLTSVIDAAHRHGTRVVLTVQSFAWTTGQARVQAALLDSAASRLNLARQIAAAVRDRGADGVNLDFEPLVSGRADEFVAFVRTLRGQLDKIARGYQLTFDTTGSIGNYPIEAATAPGGADAIFVMGYDYRTAGSAVAGAVAPLSGAGYDLTDTVRAFTDRVAPGKVILGIPYYGRAWSTVSDAPNAKTQTGAKFGPSASVTYDNAVALAAANGRRYDGDEASAWIAYKRKNCTAAYGCLTTWREVYYDDAQSIGAKYDLVNRFGLRGAGIWALGYDGTRPELYAVIVAKFLHDSTPPETGVAVLAATQGDEGFRVSWTATDLNPIRDYDIQLSVDGGPWSAWRTRTTATSGYVLGRDGHRYAVRARATDVKGNVGSWDIASLPDATPSLARGGFGTVRSTTITVRSRPDTSAGSVGKLSSGEIVSVVAGPTSADGYTWYQVTGPLTTWAPVRPTRVTGWVAARSGSTVYLAPRGAPNTTLVDAGMAGLSFGFGGQASIGPGAAALAARAFSPDGDRSEDGLVLRWRNGVRLDSLTLRVLRASDGTVLGTRAVPDVAVGARTWTWDGTIGGRTVADGRYVLQLIGRDGARTYAAPSNDPTEPDQVAAFAVAVDTVAPAIASAAVSGRILSPNGDGRSDAVTVTVTTSGGATRWRLAAAPLSGSGPRAPVRTLSGTDASPRTGWDGRADSGAVVPDGRYRLTLTILDDAGNAAARSWDLILDRTTPATQLAAAPGVISPNGDGADDRTAIRWTSGEPVTASVQVLHGSTVVRTLVKPGAMVTAGSAAWDGKDARGRPVADGSYLLRAIATDAAGNRSVATTAIRVDRTAGSLRWAPGAFYPQDGDRLAKTARVTFKLTRTAMTTLQVVDATGTVVRTAWSGRRLRAGATAWTWDGRDGVRAFARPGTYVAVLTARTALGTVILQRTILADAFSSGLSATTLTTGQVLRIALVATEPLAGRPTVAFTQKGRSPVVRVAAQVGPGRFTVAFRVAPGGTGSATIRIVARDTLGGADVSTRTVTIR